MTEHNTGYGFKSLSADENRLLNKEQKKKLLKHDADVHWLNKKWFINIVSLHKRAMEAVEAKLDPVEDTRPILVSGGKLLKLNGRTVNKPNPSPQSNYSLVLRALESGHQITGQPTVISRKLLTVMDIDRLYTKHIPKVVIEVSV